MNIDKYLDKAIKILFSMIICIMLIIGFLFVTPVYVHATSSLLELPVTSSSNTDIASNGILGWTSSTGTMRYISASGSGVYCFQYSDASYKYVVVCTPDTGKFFYRVNVTEDNQISDNPSIIEITTYDEDTNTYYLVSSNSNTVTVNSSIPTYNSLEEGLSFISSNIVNGQFYSLPQVASSVQVDYITTASQGANIYAGNPTNTYCFLGQYQTELSPTSQYCYVQTGEDAYIAVCFSSVPLTVYRAFINGETLSSSVCTQYEEGKYYSIFNQFSTLSQIEPIVPFENLSSAQAAFAGASSGGGAGSASGVVTAGAFSYNVPSGNVLYVKVRAGSLASVTVNMNRLSGTASPYWTESEINTMWAAGISSLPDNNTTFPIPGMSRIVFSPDESKGLDGYGRSNFGIAQHAPLNGGWFVIYNPAYAGNPSIYGGSAGNTSLLQINPTVTVNCQYAIEYYLYPLSESLTVNGGTSASNDGYSTPWSGQVDSSGNMQRTDDKDTEPVTGGEQSAVITENNMSLGDYLRNIEQVLSDFANSFITLLTAPISHINRLITAGSAFMTSISQFFTWLPEPVFTVITSALVVAVVIGVIKLLF